MNYNNTTALETRHDVVKGSISDIAQQTGKTLAESFMGADAIILFDISWSMSDADCAGGQTRWEVGKKELEKLQRDIPGKLAIVTFSDDVNFVPDGAIMSPQNGTDLARGLNFIFPADAIKGMRFVVISDGEPSDEESALDAARKFTNPIDTVYVGPETGSGREFLKKLAKQAGGQFMLKPKLALLAEGVHGLLGA